MAKEHRSTARLVLNIIEWVFLGLGLLLLVFVIVFASNKPGKSSGGSLFGYETRLVLTDSMNGPKEFYEGKNYKIKNIKAGECVFLSDCDYENVEKKEKFYADLKEGDVVCYYSSKYSVYITHRIIDIEEVTVGGTKDISYEIKGDNGDSEYTMSEFVSKSSNLIVGKVVGHSAFVGWVYTNLLQNKYVLYACIITPCVFCIGYETYKIIIEVNKGKKEKLALENKSKDDEIEELKRKLEEMEKQKKENKDD